MGARQQHQGERERREEQQLGLGNHMACGVGLEVGRIGKQTVEGLRKDADPDAEHRGQPHRQQHVQRSLLAADPGVVGEECAERDFDPGVVQTPAEAKSIRNQTRRRSPRAAASMTIDLLTNPLNSGKAEIEAAPTMQNAQVQGIDRYSPPTSVALIFPVRYRTAPMDMNSRALYRMWLNAWATVPFEGQFGADADARPS